MVLPLLVPRIRPDPSDKAGGSTQDQTPSCCAWPTRPQHNTPAGWKEAYQNGCNGQPLGVTLSRSPIKALGSNVSQPYNTRLDVANNGWHSRSWERAEEAAGQARLWMAGADDIYHDRPRAGWPGWTLAMGGTVRANNGWYRLHAKNRRCSK